MAHFAKVENGVVREVIVISNDDCDPGEFPDSELAGQTFIASLGLGGEWLQTSYNTSHGQHSEGGTPFRGNYAGIGFIYDEALDAFISPKPSPSDEVSDWVLDEETFSWVPAEA